MRGPDSFYVISPRGIRLRRTNRSIYRAGRQGYPDYSRSPDGGYDSSEWDGSHDYWSWYNKNRNNRSAVGMPDMSLSPGEKRRQKKVVKALQLGRGTTPWQFVLSLVDDARGFLIQSSDELPSYILRGYIEDNLQLAVHREVWSWNVHEKLVCDKLGREEDREFVAAMFIASLRWKGKLHSEFTVNFEWRDGKFEDLSYSEKGYLEYFVKDEAIPDDAGFKEEWDLD